MDEELYVSNRADWRAWLSRNHEGKKQVWLIYFRKQTGKPSIPYDDSVEEALCFGWVDSTIRKIDGDKFARKFTPRKSRSRWSEANKKRVDEMIRAGKMIEAGLARIREAKDSGEWFKSRVARKRLAVPSYLEEALEANEKALDNFNKLAESYRQNFVGWIDSAKKEETRKKRIAEAIGLLERNQKLGMK
ncbi:YdeI/OmpD-associated family protein [Candidatus Bathyarchaeota archaeon]|nr:YdeI/OmpD-associated family protein [Candidatus Bathyarchaeota archaeon]